MSPLNPKDSVHVLTHTFDRYPAEKISILTTYNGQKALINDVLERRCSWNPFFGKPGAVATVDQYQGQQNDCKRKASLLL